VRRAAALALKSLREKKAVAPLIKLLDDEHGEVRWAAAFVLGRMKDKKALDALIKALGDGDREVRYAAAVSLEEIGDEKAVGPLAALLNDSENWVRYSIASAIIGLSRRYDEKAGLQILKAAVNFKDAELMGCYVDYQKRRPDIRSLMEKSAVAGFAKLSPEERRTAGALLTLATGSRIPVFGEEEGEFRKQAAFV
jgi:HEAT repeat protein